MISIQKLSQFIDGFNFSAVKVHTLLYKNASNEMTHIMTSNTKGNLFQKDKSLVDWQDKSDEEKRLIKLLSLVSFKINERFKNLREAFRYIDTDHSQSISINEFAQAIDFFRLKIGFEDIQKLYRYMDTDGSGEIGYAEFTLLSEERWREIDPFLKYKEGLHNHEVQAKTSSEIRMNNNLDAESVKNLRSMGVKVNDTSGHMQLESLSKNHLKIPIRKPGQDVGFENINRSDPSNYAAASLDITTHGRPSHPKDKI